MLSRKIEAGELAMLFIFQPLVDRLTSVTISGNPAFGALQTDKTKPFFRI